MTATGTRLVFRSDLSVEFEQFPVPTPGPRQLVVRQCRTHVSAGSEMNFYRHNPPDGPLKRVSHGYMAVGHVEQVGAEVTEFAVDDRVLTCSNHASHALINLAAPQAKHGNNDYIQALDDAVSSDEAGFVILGDVALHGVRRAGLQIDQSVVVFGCGIVGQLTIQFARLSGAYPIVAVDLVEARLDQARVSGATHVVNAERTDAVQTVQEITGGRGGEVVFHCAPTPNVLQTAMEAAAERGTVVLTASPPGTAEIGLQRELLRRELTILGVYEIGIDQPHGYWPWTRSRNRQACLRLLAGGELRLDHLITHVVPYADAEAMVRMMVGGGADWMGVVFTWD
jgi:threonine dehydrogenase-like Zn-dependent dehydrogenase